VNNIEKAEQNIKAAQESLAQAERDLEAAKAPKPPAIRNGDYGYFIDGFGETDYPRLFLVKPDGGLVGYDRCGNIVQHQVITAQQIGMYRITGNIFDDMKAKA